MMIEASAWRVASEPIDVGDHDLRRAPPIAHVIHRAQRVDRFAGLGHCDDQGRRTEQRRAEAKLRCVVEIRGNAGDLFDPPAPDHCRMERRAHANDQHSLDARERLCWQFEILGERARRLQSGTAPNRVRQRARLLVDFLEHEMPVWTAGNGDRIEVDLDRLRLERRPPLTADRDAL